MFVITGKCILLNDVAVSFNTHAISAGISLGIERVFKSRKSFPQEGWFRPAESLFLHTGPS